MPNQVFLSVEIQTISSPPPPVWLMAFYLSCRQFVSGQVTRTDFSPAPEVSLHFNHCEEKKKNEGKRDKAVVLANDPPLPPLPN